MLSEQPIVVSVLTCRTSGPSSSPARSNIFFILKCESQNIPRYTQRAKGGGLSGVDHEMFRDLLAVVIMHILEPQSWTVPIYIASSFPDYLQEFSRHRSGCGQWAATYELLIAELLGGGGLHKGEEAGNALVIVDCKQTSSLVIYFKQHIKLGQHSRRMFLFILFITFIA